MDRYNTPTGRDRYADHVAFEVAAKALLEKMREVEQARDVAYEAARRLLPQMPFAAVAKRSAISRNRVYHALTYRPKLYIAPLHAIAVAARELADEQRAPSTFQAPPVNAVDAKAREAVLAEFLARQA
jgi:hypothetical protein